MPRSSLHCSDVAKMTGCPVIHVNGDHPEVLVSRGQCCAFRPGCLDSVGLVFVSIGGCAGHSRCYGILAGVQEGCLSGPSLLQDTVGMITVHYDILCHVIYHVTHFRGHNELDNPSLTQPLMYDTILNRPSVPDLYTKELVVCMEQGS